MRVAEIFEGELAHDALSLIGGLVQRGHDVRVVCPPEAVDAVERAGAVATGLAVTAGVGGVAALRRPLRASGAEVIHAHGLRAALASSLARPGGVPLVVSWPDPVPAGGIAGLAGWAVARTVAATADVILASTPDLVGAVAGLGAPDVRLLAPMRPQSAPVSRTSIDVRDELALDPHAPIVLARGRLTPASRHDVLIAAAARWRHRQSPPQVVIVGVGPAYRDLVAQAAVARAPVTFAGDRDDGVSGEPLVSERTEPDRATLADLIQAADLGIVTAPSARPLFGLLMAQAGRALVVASGGLLADLLGTGAIQAPAGDVDAFDAAVRHLLDDGAGRAVLGAAARAQAARWPSPDVVVEQTEAVYAMAHTSARANVGEPTE